MNLRKPCLGRVGHLFLLTLLLGARPLTAADILVPAHSIWHYLPISNDIGTAWREFDYDVGHWASGPAQLGYGDQDENTIVPFYTEQGGLKNISTYFRHRFRATNAALYTNLLVRLLRDDGAVVYLNGVELFRDNMPAGLVTNLTPALTSIFAPEEFNVFLPFYVTPNALREGPNDLAVEIHQYAGTSADISFDLELIANPLPSLPPVVTLTEPFTGAAFAPGTNALLTATASDPDGMVARVEFFADGAKLGEDTVPPFTLIWSNLPPGPHTLTARATDNTGVQSNSPALFIRVGGFCLVTTGAAWKYLDDQTDPGTAWRAPAFDDTGWSNGVAQLGFGDGDETTVFRWKIDTIPIITAYFRRQFVSPHPDNFSGLMLRLLRDDGGVVYLNGTEVFRSNMPGGPVNYSTFAYLSINTGPEESVIYFPTNLPPGLLVEGTNTLAVEIHQITQFSSTDMSFDCDLTAFPHAAATRLSLAPAGMNWELTWPAWTDRLSLQFTPSLAPPLVWSADTNAAQIVNGQWTVLLPLELDANRYYRLYAP